MKTLEQTIEIPLELLEEKYWQQGMFCLGCLEFSLQEEDFLVCPLCGEAENYHSVDYLIRTGTLSPVD